MVKLIKNKVMSKTEFLAIYSCYKPSKFEIIFIRLFDKTDKKNDFLQTIYLSLLCTSILMMIMGFIKLSNGMYFNDYPLFLKIAIISFISLVCSVAIIGLVVHIRNNFRIEKICKKAGITRSEYLHLIRKYEIDILKMN